MVFEMYIIIFDKFLLGLILYTMTTNHLKYIQALILYVWLKLQSLLQEIAIFHTKMLRKDSLYVYGKEGVLKPWNHSKS